MPGQGHDAAWSAASRFGLRLYHIFARMAGEPDASIHQHVVSPADWQAGKPDVSIYQHVVSPADWQAMQ